MVPSPPPSVQLPEQQSEPLWQDAPLPLRVQGGEGVSALIQTACQIVITVMSSGSPSQSPSCLGKHSLTCNWVKTCWCGWQTEFALHEHWQPQHKGSTEPLTACYIIFIHKASTSAQTTTTQRCRVDATVLQRCTQIWSSVV